MRLTVNDIKRMHQGHWFDKGAMEFFGTTFPSQSVDRYKMFITEEYTDFTREHRGFTIRMYVPARDEIVTIGNLTQFETLKEARRVKNVIAKALDQAGNREKAVLENLCSTRWLDDGDVLEFEGCDYSGFELSLSCECITD